MARLSVRGRVSTMVGRLFNHANPNSLVSRLRPRRSELLRELIADVTVGTSQVVRASGVSRGGVTAGHPLFRRAGMRLEGAMVPALARR